MMLLCYQVVAMLLSCCYVGVVVCFIQLVIGDRIKNAFLSLATSDQVELKVMLW